MSDHDLFNLTDPQDALVREVFAHFGRAMYMANCIERNIAAVLIYVQWRPSLKPPMTREQYEASYDAYYADLERLTMGALLRRLRSCDDVPDRLVSLLERCLEVRNTFTHHYFWTRAGEFTIHDGQLMMIKECDDATAFFGEASNELLRYAEPYLKAHGVTENELLHHQWTIADEASTNELVKDD
jgi:hypothetical protein